jgi:hypothetical protein
MLLCITIEKTAMFEEKKLMLQKKLRKMTQQFGK